MIPPINHVSKNRILTSFSSEDLKEFFSNLQPILLEQRHVLYEIGAPIDYVYFMESGVASILTTMSDGASIEVGMIGFEGMAGIPALLGNTVSVQHVVIQLPGSALRMATGACIAAFDRSIGVRRILHRFIESMLNLSSQTAACNRLHSIEQRCARWLLMSSDRFRSDILPLTHEYLAAMLGVRRAGVSDVARDLQDSNLIRYRHGQVTILDRSGLAATACECYDLDRARFDSLF